MESRVALGACSLAMLVALSGCLDGGGGEPKDPELVANEAIKAFGNAAGTQDGGAIKRISGTFEANEVSDDEGFSMSFGDATADMTFEWGKGDVVHVTFGIASGGMTFTLEAWCAPTQNVFKWGNDIYASRPAPSGSDASDEMCGDFEDMEQAESGLSMFDDETFEGLELTSLETHGDGTITATFHDAEEDGTITATIDTKGRVSRLAMETPEGSGAFDITYGTRDTISIPDANKRLPASIEWHTDVGGGAQAMTITHSPERPPLAEIEARLILRDWENDTTTTVVSFPTATSGVQTQDGYTFEYTDVDGDGRVSENDTWRFSHPDWEDSWWMEEDPDLFDLWAGKSVNESFTPAPGLALLFAVGAVGLAFVARRR